jgi:thiamine-phosphate pyrophosphorylase
MYNIISISNRALCKDFFSRTKELNDADIPIVLREKDLSEAEYEAVAAKVLELSPTATLHTYADVARKLKCKQIHLPMHILRTTDLSDFNIIGASTHSVEEAVEAQKLGATYITAGHIFATDCKKGVPPRGLDFLREVCKSVDIPVFAIGGISPQNAQSVIDVGAFGICLMSSLMTCDNVSEYLNAFKVEGHHEKNNNYK